MKMAAPDELCLIPGVGPSISQDLKDIGISRIGDLRGKDPKSLYSQLCRLKNVKMDRCVLYVFRCAVYFSENPEPESELLKWWNWKNKEYTNIEKGTL
jgi:hypothetical protein